MKPILFPANATTFTSNGLGRLDPTECVVTEERNGQYELECVVPVGSPHFGDIANNMILAVVPGDGMSVQAFRIYQITEPLNGLVELSARHISYDLSYNTVMPFTASSVGAALAGLESHAVETNPFSTWTDKSTVANFAVSVPQSFRSCLGGQRGSILDVYGGEYQFDNWTVKLWNQRGNDTDVTLRYGKNITDISQEQNLEEVVTGIVPFWADEETVVTLPEKSVDSAYASSYPYKRTVPVDFSSEYENAPTEAQIRAKAQSYITANNVGVPKVSIKVSFVALWQTEEYKSIAPLERVHLCDTVGIVFEKYGINTRAEVIKTQWDCLAERYLSIELGDARSNFASTVVGISEQATQEVVDAKTELQSAIERASAAISGNNGGYIKIKYVGDQPSELLIMNDPDETQATKIWRWNMGGLGYSDDGGTTYGTAITQDGEIVASFITTGYMSANRIKAGFLNSVALRPDGETPVTSFDLDTGKLSTVNGEFSGKINIGWDSLNNRYNFSVDNNGNLMAYSGTFGSTGTDQGITYTTTISGGRISSSYISAQTIDSNDITSVNVVASTKLRSGASDAAGTFHLNMYANQLEYDYNYAQNIGIVAGKVEAFYSSNSDHGLRVKANGNQYLQLGSTGNYIYGGLNLSSGAITISSGTTLAIVGSLTLDGSAASDRSLIMQVYDSFSGQFENKTLTFKRGVLTSVT